MCSRCRIVCFPFDHSAEVYCTHLELLWGSQIFLFSGEHLFSKLLLRKYAEMAIICLKLTCFQRTITFSEQLCSILNVAQSCLTVPVNYNLLFHRVMIFVCQSCESKIDYSSHNNVFENFF
jgi:hypothetical protein